MCFNQNNNGEYEVLWDANGLPDEKDFDFLSGHLKRLKDIYENKEKLQNKLVLEDGEDNTKKMPISEWNSIWWYYDELTRAIDAAIKHAPDGENDEL